jgi:ribosomal protein L37AE/L43A
LHWYSSIKGDFEKHRADKDFEKYSKEKFDKEVHKVTSYTVNVIKIERYRHRAERINEWMDKDRKVQEKYDKAEPPIDVYCKECFSHTEVTSKDLINSYEENSQVLFMFECVKCKKRKTLYEDGSEWRYDPPKCPKCDSSLNDNTKRTKDVLTTIYSCPSCSYQNKDVYDFKKSDMEWKAKLAKDEKLLTDYRKDFCYDDTEGPEAVTGLDQIVQFMKDLEEKEKKDKNPVYQKARQLKSLKIGQLKELLEKTIEKEGYQDLKFDKPEMGQFVIISFSVNDMKSDREERDSVDTLKKLINGALEGTTWRLMSDGVYYRLGILTGRLKAYEQEDDLVKLVGKG